MKYIPIIFGLTIAIFCLLAAVPPSAASMVACVALGLVLLYFGKQAKDSLASRSSWKEAKPYQAEPDDTPLDNDLVARIRDNLKTEPTEQLHQILAQARTGKWSPEAVQAARLLLEQRTTASASEPRYRTVPRPAHEQSAREREAVAPGFSRQLLTLDVGSRVYCRWRGESGTILHWHDEAERFYIRYDSGEGEWSTLGTFE